jgi:hypothetical protein
VLAGRKTQAASHLNTVAVAPYDGAVLTQRSVQIELGCAHACAQNRNGGSLQSSPLRRPACATIIDWKWRPR